jgi:hypothetical protein
VIIYELIFCYIFRTLLYPFLLKGKPLPLFMIVLAFFFCLVNGYLQGGYLIYSARFSDTWLYHPQFILGMYLCNSLVHSVVVKYYTELNSTDNRLYHPQFILGMYLCNSLVHSVVVKYYTELHSTDNRLYHPQFILGMYLCNSLVHSVVVKYYTELHFTDNRLYHPQFIIGMS